MDTSRLKHSFNLSRYCKILFSYSLYTAHKREVEVEECTCAMTKTQNKLELSTNKKEVCRHGTLCCMWKKC